MRRFLLLCIFQLGVVQAQDYFPTNTAVKTKELNYQAFTNATIHLNPSTVINQATLLEQNGRIVAVGQNIPSLRILEFTTKPGPIFIRLLSN
jgi:hypothetical protein